MNGVTLHYGIFMCESLLNSVECVSFVYYGPTYVAISFPFSNRKTENNLFTVLTSWFWKTQNEKQPHYPFFDFTVQTESEILPLN